MDAFSRTAPSLETVVALNHVRRSFAYHHARRHGIAARDIRQNRRMGEAKPINYAYRIVYIRAGKQQ